MFIQEDLFDDVEPDDEEYNGMVVYFRTVRQYFFPSDGYIDSQSIQVLLFMPKEYRIGYFLTPTFPRVVKTYWGSMSEKGTRYAPDVTGWIDRLSASLTYQASPLIDKIWTKYASW